MRMEPIIFSGMVFLVIISGCYTVDLLMKNWRRERDLLNRTKKWSDRKIHEDDPAQFTDVSASQSGGWARSVLIFLGLASPKKRTGPEAIFVETPMIYQRAGIYDATQLRSYEAIRYVLLILPFILLAANMYFTHRPFKMQLMVIVIILAYIGYKVPDIHLRMRARSRRKELDRTFPDAIDLLMVCVEAGMGLDAAIRRVSQEIHVTSPELAKEFRILSLELKSGKSRNTCLKSLAERTGLPDIENLVSLLIQADRYGTGVANALRVHSEEMRQKRYARLEEIAAKLPVKLALPLILFIFPSLFVVILGPAAIQVYRVFIAR